jgi:hypothetical protein
MSIGLIWKPVLDIGKPMEHRAEGFSLEDIHSPASSRYSHKWIELAVDRRELTRDYMISR